MEIRELRAKLSENLKGSDLRGYLRINEWIIPSSFKRVLDHVVFYGLSHLFCWKPYRSHAPRSVLQNLLEDPSIIYPFDMISPILPLFAYVSG